MPRAFSPSLILTRQRRILHPVPRGPQPLPRLITPYPIRAHLPLRSEIGCLTPPERSGRSRLEVSSGRATRLLVRVVPAGAFAVRAIAAVLSLGAVAVSASVAGNVSASGCVIRRPKNRAADAVSRHVKARACGDAYLLDPPLPLPLSPPICAPSGFRGSTGFIVGVALDGDEVSFR